MEIRITLTRQTMKFYIPTLLWILLVLFCISLTWESYYEMEEIAGNIFAAITVGVALAGIPVLWYAKKKSKA
jgi:hypothetical protein